MEIQSIPATLLLNLLIHLLQRKFTNDVTSDGKIKDFRKQLELLSSYDPLFRYYPQPYSSWTIVKKGRRLSAEKQFQDININITTAGKQHLGAVIRYEKNQGEYCEGKVAAELEKLAKIASTEPKAVYCTYVSGCKLKI